MVVVSNIYNHKPLPEHCSDISNDINWKRLLNLKKMIDVIFIAVLLFLLGGFITLGIREGLNN